MKTTQSIIDNVVINNVITEQEINLIKRRMNAGERPDMDSIYDSEIGLTEDQTKKGYDFLMNLWKSPNGKERNNNPFGNREQIALETFKSFTFNGYYDAGNGYHSFFIPIYWVHGEKCGFEYYYNAGKINIIG